jgi:MFS family permease
MHLSIPRAAARNPRRAHFRAVLLAFLGLGAQVGAQAVLVADLARIRALNPAALGLAFSVQATIGIAVLLVGGTLADRLGCRPLLALGSGGLGLFLLALATAPPYPS